MKKFNRKQKFWRSYKKSHEKIQFPEDVCTLHRLAKYLVKRMLEDEGYRNIIKHKVEYINDWMKFLVTMKKLDVDTKETASIIANNVFIEYKFFHKTINHKLSHKNEKHIKFAITKIFEEAFVLTGNEKLFK